MITFENMSFGLLFFYTIQPCIFHQDDVKGEQDMAAKKAALLQKRLRREKETQERKQQQEQEQEQKKEAARSDFIAYYVPIYSTVSWF